MRSRLLLVSCALLGAPLILATTAWAGGSVGSASVHSSIDGSRPGRAAAFRATAKASGRIDRLNAYLASSSTARRAELGLYRNRAGRPSTALARCVLAHPSGGRWNSCAVKPRTLKAGKAYWLTILHPRRSKGRLRFRAKRSGAGKVIPVSYTHLTLPTTPYV